VNALIGLPEISLGVIPGYGGTQRLTRITGIGRSLELMLTGKPISAEKAHDWGLVNDVVPQEQLQETTGRLAAKLAKSAPLAMRSILETVHQGMDLPLEDGLAIEGEALPGFSAPGTRRKARPHSWKNARPNSRDASPGRLDLVSTRVRVKVLFTRCHCEVQTVFLWR
jgi:enoyl-CoA hydratase/carnithine racemase